MFEENRHANATLNIIDILFSGTDNITLLRRLTAEKFAQNYEAVKNILHKTYNHNGFFEYIDSYLDLMGVHIAGFKNSIKSEIVKKREKNSSKEIGSIFGLLFGLLDRGYLYRERWQQIKSYSSARGGLLRLEEVVKSLKEKLEPWILGIGENLHYIRDRILAIINEEMDDEQKEFYQKIALMFE